MTQPARRTPRELLEARGQLADDIVAVRIDGKLVDLHTPIDPDGAFEPVRWTDREALPVIRHSAAHVMADAVQRLFPGTQVTIGPAIETGFYYDFFRTDGAFNDKDLSRIEKEMRRIIKKNVPFYRQAVSRDEARQLFEQMGELYKVEILNSIPEGEEISLYRHGKPDKPEGNWVDLCEGPHVPSTRYLGAVKLTSVAGAYWRGDEHNQQLQRIYGTAFPNKEQLDEHLRLLEEARARDHRKLGRELELFMFHEYAPAMPFFLPRGAFVYNKLIEYLRDMYVEAGYEEVITPQIFDRRLFETSGHMQNYRENMYLPVTADMLESAEVAHLGAEQKAAGHDHAALAQADTQHVALDALGQKPMNCPSHCLIFGQRRRSYRELPWRVADFGRLHRYERGGVLHGLARVRSFCQDDAHIFCTEDQAEQEIHAFNEQLFQVYRDFEFSDVAVKLALRPELRAGSDEQWDRAEALLAKVLKDANIEHEVLTGEGAFYGPKLEFHVVDAIGRTWQLGTIQVDYVLPERFELRYVGSDGENHAPVMLHRAVLGSIERFYGMYIEHVAGKFPVWLAPEQATLVTVSEKQAEYAAHVAEGLSAQGLRIQVDSGPDKLGAKIRNARLMRHPYIVVIGEKEAEAGTVSPRSREAGDLGSMKTEEFCRRLLDEARSPRQRTAEKRSK